MFKYELHDVADRYSRQILICLDGPRRAFPSFHASAAKPWWITLHVRLVFKTTEGALIGMTYCGVRHGPRKVIARLENGDAVGPARYYFRIPPLFETASAGHAWINNVVALGIGHRRADGPFYKVFEAL